MAQFTLTTKIPATPEKLYEAWLSSEGHAAMTGVNAIVSDQINGAFVVYNGYITGRNVKLIPNEKIIQTWRTTEFNNEDPDSNLELTLIRDDQETLLILTHSNIPDNSTTDYATSWEEYYFAPMKVYFGHHK